jgi:lipopolysaccharide/colanic/teichoic acid biosynthesis glycosyltransferase
MINSSGSAGLPRSVEVVLSIFGLLVASPVLLIAAILIKLDSPGPILFRQGRMGRNGKTFTLLKFRSMFVSEKGALVTASGDSRISKVGRILRGTKIDELPELWNIVRGDMSIVGPRPEVPDLVDLKDPDWNEILQVNPGLTDPVTLKLRNEEELLAQANDREDFYKNILQPYKLRGYVCYVRDRSWKKDVSIIVWTIKAILFPKTVTQPTIEELRLPLAE